MKTNKDKKVFFVCQFGEGQLKLAKFEPAKGLRKEPLALELELFPADIDDKQLSEKLNQALRKLDYKPQNPLFLSLPRYQGTCRFLKIPATSPHEIERIINLQLPLYLPYSASDLVSGYQVASQDKDGYAQINLVIAHKDLISRYLNIFNEIKPQRLFIALSSYGLINLFNYLNPQENSPIILMDIDDYMVELAVVSKNRLIFSRSFKIDRAKASWQKSFIDEIKKSRDVYSKEIPHALPDKIIILGDSLAAKEIQEIIKQQGVSCEVLFYQDKIKSLAKLSQRNKSFASVVGLGLQELSETLNLLPADLKEKEKNLRRRKEKINLAIFILSIIFIFSLGVVKNMDNKARYLGKLRGELVKVSKDTNVLGELERRSKFIEKRLHKKVTSLGLLCELYQAIPGHVTLTALSYEEAGQLLFRGQAQELNSIFNFVAQLEKSASFKNQNIKVRFATKRKTPNAEIIEFEIVCLKK